MSMLCVGTPTKAVSFSLSMSFSAASGSHLYMIASFRPATSEPSITATQPVTWNSGTARIAPPGGASGSSGGVTRAATMPRARKPMTVLTSARCVETAPLGRPVDPEVSTTSGGGAAASSQRRTVPTTSTASPVTGMGSTR